MCGHTAMSSSATTDGAAPRSDFVANMSALLSRAMTTDFNGLPIQHVWTDFIRSSIGLTDRDYAKNIQSYLSLLLNKHILAFGVKASAKLHGASYTSDRKDMVRYSGQLQGMLSLLAAEHGELNADEYAATLGDYYAAASNLLGLVRYQAYLLQWRGETI